MAETMTAPAGPESRVGEEVVGALRWMTDGVLERAGFALNDPRISPIVEFSITKPGQRYKLTLYSIADGTGGFNTSTGQKREGEDNSRRWSVHVDRGNDFAAAFDNKGTVYEHGGFEDSPYPKHAHNVSTGSIEDLLFDFYDNPDGMVTFQFLPEREDRNQPRPASSVPVMLHPLPA
jgi:hypothetical protein